MPSHILLVLESSAEARIVQGMLLHSGHGAFTIEWVSLCADACNRLRDQCAQRIDAILVDPALPDTHGIETINGLLNTSAGTPILVLSDSEGEAGARFAVRHGAQDYLLKDRLDAHSLFKAIANMLDRSRHAEGQLMENARARITLDSIGDAVISTDIAGNITYMNSVAESITGWLWHEAYGRPFAEVLCIINGTSGEAALNPLAMAVRCNEAVGLSANSVLIRRDGRETAIEDTAAPIRDSSGQVVGAVIVFRDVTVARAMSLRMSYLAQHDCLTELPNRLLLNDRLTQAIAAARRHQTSVAVLFADVDHFKRVNDTRGHSIGDGLLKSIARRLVSSVRTTDTVSRHGGDEFVVLLSEVAHAQDAALSATKILRALCAPHTIEERDLRVTVSIGVSVFPNDGADAETLVKNADTALLHAKHRGRSRCEFFEPGMSARITQRWTKPAATVVRAPMAAHQP